ncbi:MAG TPA: alkaline phosphatase family protein, partial [Saprospiraceae bacterium]|nr:alkaline phosphatase family protein [Saprospiraceae bacterium]
SGAYSESFSDWDKYNDGDYVSYFAGAKMPYDLPALKKKGGYGVLRFTPFGNTLTTDFAIETVSRMQLGADDVPDLLCVSYSSSDYCGHQFGIHGEEMEDLYLRLDREIARLLDFLDKKFGKNNVLVFLTADHGGAETPPHMNDLRIPAGIFPESKLEDVLEKTIADAVGTPGNFINEAGNQQIWLNWDAMTDLDIKPDDVASAVIDYLRAQPGVYDAFTREELMMFPAEYPYAPELRRGIHLRRSGDILFQLDPAWHPDDKAFGKGGTTHGSPYPYDTHVPLLWYGWKIKPGVTYAPVNIIDIAPTVAAMLRIMEPNGCQGKVIEEVMGGN